MATVKVIVWDRERVVETSQASKSVWTATGTYMGKTHATKDSTEGAAVKRWREWATTQGG